MKKYLYIFYLLPLFFSCNEFDDDVEDIDVKSGTADFSIYVSLGNSLTAGYQDGALYKSGQENSWPAITARQMQDAGNLGFKQPLMSDDLGGISIAGLSNKRILTESLSVVLASGTSSNTLENIYSQGPYHNLGVPGAKSFHLVTPGFGSLANLQSGRANPYFVRFSSSANTTVLADAVSLNPTFFSLWIGNNDILGYATSGGSGVDQTGNLNVATYGPNDITDPSVFANTYNSLVNALTANEAKGILISIPSVTAIPYFTTVTYNAIPLTAQQATAANTAYSRYNAGINQIMSLGLISQEEANKRQISFSEGNNAIVFTDDSLTNLTTNRLPSIRQATDKDLILLTAVGLLGTLKDPNNPASVIGVGEPVGGSYVLTNTEINNIKNATLAYNASIKNIAESNNLAFLDIDQLFEVLNSNSGIIFNGVTYKSDFITGGSFSLDGVHPNQRGFAVIANEIIKTINSTYGSNLSQVDVNSYPGIDFP